jgi:hypothetical protein
MLLLSPLALAQSGVFLLDRDGNPGRLSELEKDFIRSRFELLDIASCNREELRSYPRVDYRRLEVAHQDEILMLHVSPDVMRSNAIVLYAETASGLVEYTNCETGHLLPVLALMVTANFEDATRTSLIRQRILAQNSWLTSYESNRLMARGDSDDSSGPYMDFRLSSKHPILPNAVAINEAYDQLTDVMDQFIPGESEYFLQLYLAFSGRFSQYIGTRESSPVVARRFGPELFYRFWSTDVNFVDLGIGHESNGHRIDTEERFLQEGAAFVASGESRDFARDGLSRGWDYTAMNWQHAWNDNLVTQVRMRHFLPNGPLQGSPEEYNTWEDGGTQLRPRRQYDGLSLDLQYLFNESRCLRGNLPICFRKLQLTQETGYSAPFDNNTTTLELTTDFFGLPIQVWSRTGYNSDLVDYYNYSNSWGLGIELISR